MSKLRTNQLETLDGLNTVNVADIVDDINTGSVTTSTGTQALAEALDKRVIYVSTLADLEALPTSNLIDGQTIAVLNEGGQVSGRYAWDATTSNFIQVSERTGVSSQHSFGGVVQNEYDYATLGNNISPDLSGFAKNGFDGAGLHTPGSAATMTAPVAGSTFAHYLLKVEVDTTSSGYIQFRLGDKDVFDDTPEGYYFSTDVVLESGIENGQPVNTTTFWFLALTSGTSFSELSLVTDESWGGTVSSVELYELNATQFIVAGAGAESAGPECPVGIKSGAYLRGDMALGDKYTLGAFHYIGTGPTPAYNFAAGTRALGSLVKGKQNTAIGSFALQYTEGSDNVGVGYSALKLNTKGQENTAVGYKAGVVNTTGYRNTYMGFWAAGLKRTGKENCAFGWYAGRNATGGSDNTYIGSRAGLQNASGSQNTHLGHRAGYGTGAADSSYHQTTAVGNEAQVFGDMATAVGSNAAAGVQGGSAIRGTSIGPASKARGSESTAVGYAAGSGSTGINNTFIGSRAGIQNASSFTNITCLGFQSEVTGASQVQLGNSNTTVYAYGPVQDRSDSRDKTDIQELTDAHIAFFMDVEWRQFRLDYRDDYDWGEKDGSKARERFHIGAIAQQVESAMKKHGIDFAGLQHHSINGGMDVYTIGYQEFIGIQGEIIQRQQSRLDSIEARLTAGGL